MIGLPCSWQAYTCAHNIQECLDNQSDQQVILSKPSKKLIINPILKEVDHIGHRVLSGKE